MEQSDERLQQESPDAEETEAIPESGDQNLKRIEDEVQSPRLWTDIISGNRVKSRGLAINFSAPTIVNGDIEITIDESDVESEKKFWESSLIMYVLGGDLTMNSVK